MICNVYINVYGFTTLQVSIQRKWLKIKLEINDLITSDIDFDLSNVIFGETNADLLNVDQRVTNI